MNRINRSIPLLDFTYPILEESEHVARSGDPIATLTVLRRLSIEEFGLVFISMPDQNFPNLSALLPDMTSPGIQKAWTGSAGRELLAQSVSFVRQLESLTIRHAGKPLQNTTILDFGCGYGRILRMMYYFTNPDNLFGVDAWQKSLDFCKQDRIWGNLRLSELKPTILPVNDVQFDLAYAFSVFTHLAEPTALAAFSAIRKCIKPTGLLIVTVRPVEFWEFRDHNLKHSEASRLTSQHGSSGFAYAPHNGPEGVHYGDASISREWLERLPNWRLLGHDYSSIDHFQLPVVLKPV